MKLLTVTNITYAAFYFFIATLPTAIFEYSLSFSLSEINVTVDSDQYYICCVLFYFFFYIATLPTAIFEYSLSFSLSEINETVDSDQYYICCILFFL